MREDHNKLREEYKKQMREDHNKISVLGCIISNFDDLFSNKTCISKIDSLDLLKLDFSYLKF